MLRTFHPEGENTLVSKKIKVRDLIDLTNSVIERFRAFAGFEEVYIRTDIVEGRPIPDECLQRTYHPKVIVNIGGSQFSYTLDKPLIRNCGSETANRLDAMVRAYEGAIGLIVLLRPYVNEEKIRINELPITDVEEQKKRYSQELSDLVKA